MQKSLFTIFDEISGVYCNPFISINDDTATRDFKYACTQDVTSDLYRHKQDFHLIRIGDYDDETGEIKNDRTIICSGINLVRE